MSRFRESEAVNPMAEMRWPRADDGNPMTEIRCRESMMRFWLNSLSHGEDYEREEREIEQAGLTHNRHKGEHLSHGDRLVITLWPGEWQWVLHVLRIRDRNQNIIWGLGDLRTWGRKRITVRWGWYLKCCWSMSDWVKASWVSPGDSVSPNHNFPWICAEWGKIVLCREG